MTEHAPTESEALRARMKQNIEQSEALTATLAKLRQEARQIAADLLRADYGIEPNRFYEHVETIGYGADVRQQRIVVVPRANIVDGYLRVKAAQVNRDGRETGRFLGLRDADLRALTPVDLKAEGGKP